MLEEMDLTSEQRIRHECLELAVQSQDVGYRPEHLMHIAERFKLYILEGHKNG